MTGSFYNFNWGSDGNERAEKLMEQFKKADTVVAYGVTGVLLASVVTARGRQRSPSGVFENLIADTKRTNEKINDAIAEAWSILAEEIDNTVNILSTLQGLLTPRHRNKTGLSPTLKYQVTQSYEALLDTWVCVGDYLVGFRTLCTKVLQVNDNVGVADYLHRGMMRNKLLATHGDDVQPTE